MISYSFTTSVITESVLAFLDNTPDYDALNYPNGIGSPNPERSDVSALTVTLTDRDGNSFTIDLLGDHDFVGTLKRVEVESDDPEFTIIDGVYDIEFTVTDTDGTQTITDTFFVDYNMKCELSRLASSGDETFAEKKAIYDRAVYSFLQGTATLVNSLVDVFFAEEDTDACC